MAPMSKEERLKHKRELMKALLTEDENNVRSFFEEEYDVWTEIKFFLSALTPDQQSQVLHGDSVSIDLKAASPEATALFHQYYSVFGPHESSQDGGQLKPEPTSVSYFLAAPNRSRDQLIPLIGLSLSSNGNGGTGNLGTGILEFGVKEAIRRAWFLPGDRRSDPIEKTLVKESNDTDSIRSQKVRNEHTAAMISEHPHPGMSEEVRERMLASMRSSLDTPSALYKLGAGSITPIVAVLPSGGQDSLVSPVGRSVGDFVHGVDNRAQRHFCKWRNGVLLTNYPFWFVQPAVGIPYSELSKIRPDKSGITPLSKWVEFMHGISDDEAEWFGKNYGVQDIKSLRECMGFLYLFPAAASADGVTIDQNTVHTLVSLRMLPQGRDYSPDGTLVRVTEAPDAASRGVSRHLSVELFDKDRNRWLVMNSNFEFPAQIEAITAPAKTQK
jgi:hypothetical protein